MIFGGTTTTDNKPNFGSNGNNPFGAKTPMNNHFENKEENKEGGDAKPKAAPFSFNTGGGGVFG
jgi:hypothetical protein